MTKSSVPLSFDPGESTPSLSLSKILSAQTGMHVHIGFPNLDPKVNRSGDKSRGNLKVLTSCRLTKCEEISDDSR